jgi:hypothetical protein
LSADERAALLVRLDSKPTKTDRAFYDRDVAARIASNVMSPTAPAG